MTYRKFFLIGTILLMTSACDQPLNIGAKETLPAHPTATITLTVTPVPASPTLPPATTLPVPPVTDTLPPPTIETLLPPDTATPESITIIGEHLIRAGETLSCIGRGYGVVPQAIAEANHIQLTTILYVGQVLKIPATQWINIPAGPVCQAQFPSPFPGLPVTGPTSLPLDTPTPTLQVPDTLTPTVCASRACP